MLVTELHGMQMRCSDENSLSVKRKKDMYRFLYHTKDNLS